MEFEQAGTSSEATSTLEKNLVIDLKGLHDGDKLSIRTLTDNAEYVNIKIGELGCPVKASDLRNALEHINEFHVRESSK